MWSEFIWAVYAFFLSSSFPFLSFFEKETPNPPKKKREKKKKKEKRKGKQKQLSLEGHLTFSGLQPNIILSAALLQQK